MINDNKNRARLGPTGSAAALIGLGAVLAGSAYAAPTAEAHGYATPGWTETHGEVVLRVDDGRLFLSQGGRDLGEIKLTDTPASAALRALLEQDGLTGSSGVLRMRPMIVADGGASAPWPRALMPPNPANRTDVRKAAEADGQGTGKAEVGRGPRAGAEVRARSKVGD